MSTETDEERKARTDLSSVRMADDESRAVQKTPNRVTLDSMLARVMHCEFINPDMIPHMTICVMMVDNGFAIVGKSAPADPGNFDRDLGCKFAKEDCIRQMWQLEAYALRERMWQSVPPEVA